MTAPASIQRRGWLSALLFTGMGVATFTGGALGILATFVIDDLGISRAKLGVAVAVVNVASALLSPVAGRLTDRVGGRTALVALFAAAAATFVVLGMAFAYAVLIVGALIGAFSQSSANPATNKLIAEHYPLGERGSIVGIKQSGVQAGVFLGGLTLPSLAEAVGWRGAFLIVAIGPAVLAAVTMRIVPRGARATDPGADRVGGVLPPSIWWLTGYGSLMGFSAGVVFLVPLFSEEALGLSPVVAGVAAATIALVAVFGRIAWSRFAEQAEAYRLSLGIMALLAVLGPVLFLLSDIAAAWLLWPACAIIAAGSGSWNSVGMLTVMVEAGSEATGRASGRVMLGFLTGLGVSSPIFGAVVDRTGSYDAMWLLSAGTAVAALVLTRAWATRAP